MWKILVVLDDSPGKRKALKTAIHLAQGDGELAALAVRDCSNDAPFGASSEGVRTRALRSMREHLQTAGKLAQSFGVRLTPYLREGHFPEVIVSCAEETNAELLVVDSDTGKALRVGSGGTADPARCCLPCVMLIVNS